LHRRKELEKTVRIPKERGRERRGKLKEKEETYDDDDSIHFSSVDFITVQFFI
jgi:hypothetical protein